MFINPETSSHSLHIGVSKSMILPTYPCKIPQSSPTPPQQKRLAEGYAGYLPVVCGWDLRKHHYFLLAQRKYIYISIYIYTSKVLSRSKTAQALVLDIHVRFKAPWIRSLVIGIDPLPIDPPFPFHLPPRGPHCFCFGGPIEASAPVQQTKV